MIKLTGNVIGSEVTIEVPNHDVCAYVQSHIISIIDIIKQEGCPDNCKYLKENDSGFLCINPSMLNGLREVFKKV